MGPEAIVAWPGKGRFPGLIKLLPAHFSMSKPKTALKVVPKVEIDPRADELGDLDRELAPWKAKLDRCEDLRRELRAVAADKPALEVITIHGKRWTVILGTKPNDAEIKAFTRKGSRPITIVEKSA